MIWTRNIAEMNGKRHHKKFGLISLKEETHLGDLGVDGTLLKFIFET
jgi:hypothetical protein